MTIAVFIINSILENFIFLNNNIIAKSDKGKSI